jgi:hypothetical protein
LTATSETPLGPLFESSTKRNRSQYVFTALALVCIAAIYVVSIVQLHPTNLFGLTGDDGIYMSSAKALAEGKGYVMPNLPGSPPATKYPILYPWILSFVWRASPLFPANVPLAIAVSVAFGVGFLMAAFAMFSSLGGFSRKEALIMTAYLGLHPLVMLYGASVLSDMPFAFIALSSLLVADRAMRGTGAHGTSFCCGILAGISALTRILGFPIMLGILITGIARRSWRQLAIVATSVTPFVALATWRAIFSTKLPSPITGPAGQSLGWTHAWTFYTDYVGIWRVGVPDVHVFWLMLKNNAGMILREPADLLLGPTFVRDTMLGRVLILVAAVTTLTGILRQGKQYGWKPIHFASLLYIPVLLLWNYPDASRFSLPFWPLLVAGVWAEGRHLVRLIRSTLSRRSAVFEKGLGLTMGLAVTTLVCGVAENSVAGVRTAVEQISRDRQGLLRDKLECYDWIRRNTDSNDRVVAYEDAVAYLYTGRQTVRPTIFTTDEFYEPQRLSQEVSHFVDVAQAIQARYWLLAADDFNREWPAAFALKQNHMRRVQNELQVTFQGSRGTASVHLASRLADGCGVEGDGGCDRTSTFALPTPSGRY